MDDKIIKQVNNYYTEKINTFGPTSRGVDWNSQESQELRFSVLCDVIDTHEHFSILDYGCGFGSLFQFLQDKNLNFRYTGLDISDAMLEQAKRLYPSQNVEWTNALKEATQWDFVVASGLFNVRLETPVTEWETYLFHTLDIFNRVSSRGFAFNVLTSYSDKEFMKDYLYYANPGKLFDHCKKKYSKKVALLHDYPLYEFTVVVRK